LLHSNNNNIRGNTIWNNGQGIYLNGDNNKIKDNTISSNNKGGISLRGRINTIIGNTISNNYYAIYLSEGNLPFPYTRYPRISFNIIFKNNFIDNEQDANFVNSLLNLWWRNYWNEPRLLPKPIIGVLYFRFGGRISYIDFTISWRPQFDWFPAKEPYDI